MQYYSFDYKTRNTLKQPTQIKFPYLNLDVLEINIITMI